MNDSTASLPPTDPDAEYVAMDEAELTEFVRRIARDEISSMAALVLRRSQDAELSRSPTRNATDDQIRHELAQIFGEVLADFSKPVDPLPTE